MFGVETTAFSSCWIGEAPPATTTEGKIRYQELKGDGSYCTDISGGGYFTKAEADLVSDQEGWTFADYNSWSHDPRGMHGPTRDPSSTYNFWWFSTKTSNHGDCNMGGWGCICKITETNNKFVLLDVPNKNVYQTSQSCSFKRELDVKTGENYKIQGNGDADVYLDAHSIVRFAKVQGTLEVKNLTLQNGIGLNGGAIFVSSTGFAKFESVLFKACSSHLGGAIFIDDQGSATFKQSTFEGNTASQGGALYVKSQSQLLLRKVNFNHNKAEGDAAVSSGGAIFINVQGGDVNSILIQDSAFNSNAATRGGAVRMSGSNVKFVNTNFTTNVAISKASSPTNMYGGAIYVCDTNNVPATPRFESCVFDGNSVMASDLYESRGGAIYFQRSSGEMHDVVFKKNLAKLGGAIFFVNDEDAILIFAGSTFLTNTEQNIASAGNVGGHGIFGYSQDKGNIKQQDVQAISNQFTKLFLINTIIESSQISEDAKYEHSESKNIVQTCISGTISAQSICSEMNIPSCSMTGSDLGARMTCDRRCLVPVDSSGYNFDNAQGNVQFDANFAVSGILCAEGWGGVVVVTKCTDVNTKYSVSGCTLNCIEPSDTTGYVLAKAQIVDFDSFAITIDKCATGYSGTPLVGKCANPGDKYSLSGCVACPAGKISGSVPNTCDVCHSGKYTDRVASITCLACGAGKFAPNTHTPCQSCLAGYFQPNSISLEAACQACAAGMFNQEAGQDQCVSTLVLLWYFITLVVLYYFCDLPST
jgi:predicted outer membrane repeat protein